MKIIIFIILYIVSAISVCIIMNLNIIPLPYAIGSCGIISIFGIQILFKIL